MDITSNPHEGFFYRSLLGKKLVFAKSIEEAHRFVKKRLLVCLPRYPRAVKTLRYFSTGEGVLALCMKHVWEKPHLLKRWFFYGQWGRKLGTRITVVSLGMKEKSDMERAAVLAMLSGSQCYGRRGAELLREVLEG